ncbi:MAG: hypothetical protein QG673_1913 [Pseudomonadota bacterium]|nr:hypothetical protein [Pseudomonadota bacterium]
MTQYFSFNKEKIFSDLDKLESKPKTNFTANEIAKLSRTKIRLALKKCYTFAEIAKWFNDNDCKITHTELEDSYNKLINKNKRKPIKSSLK